MLTDVVMILVVNYCFKTLMNDRYLEHFYEIDLS